jgi:ABC-type Mn2+/Zn2+ transport system permease subunit
VSEIFTYAYQKSAVDSDKVRLSRRAQKNEYKGETDMKTKILGLLAVGLLAGPMAANAVTRTYDFTVNGGPSGALAGVTSSGYFAFDESIIPALGGTVNQSGLLTALSFTWNGISYNQSTANTGQLTFDSAGNLASQSFFGTTCGAFSCSVTSGTNQWFINLFTSGGTTFQEFNYATPTAPSTIFSGTFTYSLRKSSVPEPGTLALLGLGLAGLGLSRRRKAN